jgi:hypothetical protein
MGKQPAFQFYPGDWQRDTELQMVSPVVRGVWINLLCAMFWAKEQGKISGDREQICRLAHCNNTELDEFLRAHKQLKFCRVTVRNKKVTIVNRRMHRDYLERKANAQRQLRHRKKKAKPRNDKSNDEVTPYSASPTASPTPNNSSNNIIALWNRYSCITKKVTTGAEELAVERGVSELAHRTDNPIHNGEILEAAENYASALKLPQSKAPQHRLYNFLTKHIEKYRPGIFDIDHFDGSKWGDTEKTTAQQLQEDEARE